MWEIFSLRALHSNWLGAPKSAEPSCRIQTREPGPPMDMASKYAEAYLGVRFRTTDSKGEQAGEVSVMLIIAVSLPSTSSSQTS